MPDLTSTQRRIFDFLTSFQDAHGRTPSGPEIAEEFGYGDPSTVYQHLRAIAKKGYLDIEQAGHRRPLRIVLTQKAERLLGRGWPMFGTIPAGPVSTVLAEDVEIVEGVEDFFPMIREGDYFLMVEGDSMLDAGLEEGMTVLMRPATEVKPGTICAVWVEGEGGTLKRVYEDGEVVRLVPENKRYAAKTYPAGHIRIQGRLMAAMWIRQF